jgi:signal transduction histidine kinase
MRSLQYHNSLFLMGVLIVLLPCLLNSVFVFYLNKHWQQTAQDALTTEQRLGVVLALNDGFRSFLTFGYDVLTNTFRESRASQHGNELGSSDSSLGNKIVAMPPESKKLSGEFIEIRHDIDHLLENIENVEFHDGRSRFNSFAGILKKACASGSSLDTMLQEQAQRSSAGAIADKKLYSDARQLLLIAVLTEIVISLLLFLLFVFKIVRRLRVLAGNAARLNQWSEQPALGGADELSFLDSVFKEAGARIEAIEKHCREQKVSIATVMKTPAPAIKAFFAAAQKNAIELSPDEESKLKQWSLSANLALSRLEASTASLVPAKVDNRSNNAKNIKGTKRVEPDLSQLELFDVVESCIQELLPLASAKGVALVNNCERNLMSAKRDKLTLVIMKYLVNALKNAPAKTEIIVNQALRDNWINFSVRDVGPALSSSAQKQVFNDGTNGLYICKSIVENEGGKFGAKALGALGNEFWFALPVVPRKSKSAFSIDELMGVGGDLSYKPRKFIFQSSLFRKAALIVFIPMILHLVLFFWMSQQLQFLQKMIDKGHREESLTLVVSSLWLNSFIASSSAAIFLTSRDKTYYTNAVSRVNRVDESVSELNGRGDLTPDELLLIRQAGQFAASQSNLVKQGMNDDSFIGINKTLALLPAMFNRSAQISDQLNHLMDVESHKTYEAMRQQVDLQSFMEKVVYGAIFLNFIGAVLLIRFFIVNFNNRINGLVIKARMVADGQPLPAFDDWVDEVDQIQGFLALASKSVIMVNESQSAALSMVAQEVSSPLETLDALFEIIQSVPQTQVCWSPEQCANVRRSLESAFEMVDQLLLSVA